MNTTWGKARLEEIIRETTPDTAATAFHSIGRLAAANQVEQTDAVVDLCAALLDRGFDAVTAIGSKLIDEYVSSGLESPWRPGINPGEYILLPGEHLDDQRVRIERSTVAFADEVLEKINPDSLYRLADVVGSLGGDVGQKRFRTASIETVRILADSSLKFATWVQSRGKTPPRLSYSACSRDAASLILARAQTHPRVRQINLIVSYPVFIPSGMIQPGYTDGYYYDQPPELDPIPVVEDHRAVLDDLLIDFPFRSAADRENYIGLLLTPILRPTLRGNTPLFLIQSSMERSGKTKLAEQVLGRVILGQPTPAMQLSGDESEIDKRIVSMLLRGDTICHVDNLSDFIDSGAFASLITSATYSGRFLGRNDMPKLPNNMTIVGTGNNVRATGELVKRSVPIFLQPLDDTPQLRTDFRHQPIESYLDGVRVRVLGALITMVRQWSRAGKTPGTIPLGGFERWASIVGGIMQFHGYDQWMTNYREWCKNGDPQGEDLAAFVAEWARRYRSAPQKPKDLWAICVAEGWFSNLVGHNETSTLSKFGRFLAKNENRPVGKTTVKKAPMGGCNLWYLQGDFEAMGTPERESTRQKATEATYFEQTF